MSSLRIVNGTCFTPRGRRSATVTIANGKIEHIGEAYSSDGDDSTDSIDATGLFVAPGFIDIQINGGFGFDLQAEPEAVWELGRLLPQTGVTSFLPTIISSEPTVITRMVQAMTSPPPAYRGARPIGIHLEGPMICEHHVGTHDPAMRAAPTLQVVDKWHRDQVRLVTMAPELNGALPVIAELKRRGIAVAAGHTAASAEQAQTAVAAGVTGVTHLFNAMAPLGHRSPNLVGVALTDDRLTVSLIADGVHVDPIALRLAWKAKGPTRTVVVTDAVAAMGCAPGEYSLADRRIVSDGTSVRNEDGTLAGSVLTMSQAVGNLMDYTQCPLDQAITSASATPAELIGERHRGCLVAAQKADLVVVDQRCNVQATVCGGVASYVAPEARARLSRKLSR